MNAQSSNKKPFFSVFVITLGSAMFLTVERVIDSVVSNNYAIANDPIVASSAYLFIGGWFGLLISIVLGKVMGKYVPNHKKIAWPKKRPLRLSIFAGISAAFSTLVFLWGNQHFDLSIMIAISNGYVLMIVIYEWIGGKIKSGWFLIPGLITVVSTIFVAFSPEWSDSAVLRDKAWKLVFVFFVFNILMAFDRLVTKPAVDRSDPINVQVIRIGTLAVIGTFSAFTLAIVRQEFAAFIGACQNILASPPVYLCLFFLFAAVFMGQVLELWAKRINVDVSSIAIVIGIHVGLGFVAALVIDAIAQGLVGEVPADWTTRSVRLVGVSGLILATILLQARKAR